MNAHYQNVQLNSKIKFSPVHLLSHLIFLIWAYSSNFVVFFVLDAETKNKNNLWFSIFWLLIVNWKWKKWMIYKLLRSNSLLPAVLTDCSVRPTPHGTSLAAESNLFSVKVCLLMYVCYTLPDSFPHRGHTVALTLWFSDTEHLFDKVSKCDGTFLHAYVHVSFLTFWHTFTHTYRRPDNKSVARCEEMSSLVCSSLPL